MNSPDKKKVPVSIVNVGEKTDEIKVKISHKIIHLFSEGLYSSPNKALEELISNSFDAGAKHVHAILSSDLQDSNATIVVVDDGEGMDAEGLKNHWVIGRSTRRKEATGDRKPIGKFGIGKLATYVLASHLTHICKVKGNYFATTMDYNLIETPGEAGEVGVFDEKPIPIPLRTLSADEAEKVLTSWITGTKDGYQSLRLFGDSAAESWTVAILSGLTEMGRKIQRGRLRWVLRTAMPLRDDFKLYFDGDKIEPSKTELPLIEKWIIGKDINQLDKPCPEGFEPSEDVSAQEDSIHRFGLSHPELGRITGYVELYEDDLSGGKSDEIERSNGFFVYVRGRMINTEDPGFGIERNLLRHGTFARFRMIVHIDSLDKALRSSRESLQQGELYTLAKNYLHAVFNLVRNRLNKHAEEKSPGAQLASRLATAPASMTRRPVYSLIQAILNKKYTAIYTKFPETFRGLSLSDALQKLNQRADSGEGIVKSTELQGVSSTEPIAAYDFDREILTINTFHPFVASFISEYEKPDSRLPLQMFAMSEVLTEAHLVELSLSQDVIHDILARRDQLLRQVVRASGRRTAQMISVALSDAKENKNQLELELVAAFHAMGFENAAHHGGPGKPDGTAEAYLPAAQDGSVQQYKVLLSAKSGGVVTAHRLDVAQHVRHMHNYGCNHCLVIGNSFQTFSGKDSASVDQITREKEQSGRTITLMLIDDCARLVRLAIPKRLTLIDIRDLFTKCITPEQSKTWIDAIEKKSREPYPYPYEAIVQAIRMLQEKRNYETISYQSVTTALMMGQPQINLKTTALKECCRELAMMSRGGISALEGTVELNKRADLVIGDVREALKDYDILP